MYYIRKYGLFLMLGLAVVIGFFLLQRDRTASLEVEHETTEQENMPQGETATEPKGTEEESETTQIAVDIKGQIQDPGVYTVESSARVHDVIELAGGFSKEADENQINLAQRVYDEMYIYIPKTGETELPSMNMATEETNDTGDKVRVNQASSSDLETLSGIGPGKAEAIIEYIEDNGPLESVDELLEVSGIGEKTLENFEADIIIP